MAMILNGSKQEVNINNYKVATKELTNDVIKIPRTKLLQGETKYLTEGTKT